MNPTTRPDLPAERTPEDGQGQMRDTRRHMSGQMHELGDKVTGMAQDAADAVDDAVRGVRDAVHTTTEQVRGASESALASVRRLLDVRGHARRHPWLAVGGAVVLGLICGRFVGRR
jgi:ElaB/YqjD/DUF883 family membrane-anchored ribosome-binding protein